MGVSRLWLVLVIAALAVGCADKAEAGYAACVAAEAKGDVLTAATACEQAITADPTSTSGEAAAAKLAVMQPAIEKARKEKAEADAKAAEERQRAAEAAAQAAAKAKAERVAGLRAKVKVKYWDLEPEASCRGEGKPEYAKTYEGGTYDENDLVAFADGCQRSSFLRTAYCCPGGPSYLGLKIKALQESGVIPR